MSDLSHDRVRAYLQLGRPSLTRDEQAAVDEHLRVCADCRAYAEHMARLQAGLTRTMHQQWDAKPVPDFAPRLLPRLQKSRLPQQVFSYAIGLGALAALILLLQAFFTAQLQPAAQSPVVTALPAAGATIASPLVSTAIAEATVMRPTPTLPTGRDFYRVQRVTNTATGAFRPAVSPDGQRVAYASERDGNWDIYVIDLRTSAETRLTDDPLNDMAPAWSPDGAQIAYQHNVLSPDGPVLVDRMVMNADGSNKIVVSSGAHWLGNEAPAWSPAGDRIAFADSNAIVVVSVIERREVQRLAVPENQGVYTPAWFDEQRVLFVSNGQLRLGDVESGGVQQVFGLSGSVNVGLAANPKIVYVGQNGATQIGEVQLDGTQPMMWANFPPGSINHAALSPDGKFVAVQADSGLYVATNGLPASWQSQPLFHLDQNVPTSDLLSVSWLPDSSGFVFVSLADGKPELHLAQLNMPAIDYLKSLPSSGITPAPTLDPSATSAVSSIATSFWPDPSIPVDGSIGFPFGATITATSPISLYAHIVAFALRPEELLEACTTRDVPTDRPFWANQAEFAPGQVVYGQGFAYANDIPGADRLVVRINLVEPGTNGRLLYCEQQVYLLLPAPLLPTPRPTSTPWVTPPLSPMLYETPTPPPVPPTPAATPNATATVIAMQQTITARRQPRLCKSYPSPDGKWQAQVVIYDCVEFSGWVERAAYDQRFRTCQRHQLELARVGRS